MPRRNRKARRRRPGPVLPPVEPQLTPAQLANRLVRSGRRSSRILDPGVRVKATEGHEQQEVDG